MPKRPARISCGLDGVGEAQTRVLHLVPSVRSILAAQQLLQGCSGFGGERATCCLNEPVITKPSLSHGCINRFSGRFRNACQQDLGQAVEIGELSLLRPDDSSEVPKHPVHTSGDLLVVLITALILEFFLDSRA